MKMSVHEIEVKLPPGSKAMEIRGLRIPVAAVVWPNPIFQSREELGVVLGSMVKNLCYRDDNFFVYSARGVKLQDLTKVLQRGIDVIPTTAPVFVCNLGFSKALEYGGNDVAMLVLDNEALENTFCELQANATEEERERCRKKYVSETLAADGSGKVWFSMLAAEDRRLTTGYEIAYARWIPGDPWQALKAVFVIGRDGEELVRAVEHAVSLTQTPETPEESR